MIDVQLAVDAIAEGPSPLTQRKHDVLAAATPQATAADVAQRLHLSEGTVRNYLSAAIRKVGARKTERRTRDRDRQGLAQGALIRKK